MGFVSILRVVLAIIFAVLIARGIQYYHEYLRQQRLEEDQVLEYHRQVADFTFSHHTTLEDRLKLRAKPNTRLVTTFNINNSFTTEERHVHHDFLKRANSAIHLVHTADWIKLGQVAKTSLDLCQRYFKDGLPYIPLASFVRVVSFGLVLHILFGVEPSEVDLDEARKATEAINRLWIQSKNQDCVPSLYDKTILNNALGRLLPEEFLPDDGIRPLDLIMPAYETLWRVVLLTFVSMAGKNVDPTTEAELQEALHSVPHCFCQKNDAEMRALAIAKEGLRLYPPTKRIYRATSTIDGESGVVAADVEACHRNGLVWGTDALQFKPRRFHNWPREEARRSYFPFGVGRHLCPAPFLAFNVCAFAIVSTVYIFYFKNTNTEFLNC
ncbi:cytochrome P450 [Hypoxylon argillaceum]|nr:cytochrome P450 [Hypoxylon argillaceum]